MHFRPLTHVRPTFVASLCAASISFFALQTAYADVVASFDVGTGSSASTLQFDFANGNTYVYTVRWDGVVTGENLFDICATSQPSFFSFSVISFSFGDALFGVTIGSDTDSGFGSPPLFLDYWHYWTRADAIDPWASASVGFGDRIVSDGTWDGWVFGSDSAPATVPAPPVVALLSLAVAGRTRRRVH